MNTRRGFLKAGAGALAILGLGSACGNAMREKQADASPRRKPVTPTPSVAHDDDHPHDDARTAVATPTCNETEDNIEGPYYRDGAPLRDDLIDGNMKGTRLRIHGQVLGMSGGAKAPTCAILAGALLDVWQADSDGHYDNDGSMGRPRRDFYRLRGKLVSDAKGGYEVHTIVPGRYLNGAQYRPAHVHVKLSADGFAPLTTQLYFPGDPYNDIDPFIKKSLIMAIDERKDHSLDASFDFVLEPATT